MTAHNPELEHAWNVTAAQARAIQTRLAARVETVDSLGEPRRVAGVDVGFEDGGKRTRAAVAVLDIESLEVVETAVARLPTRFPYVPGLLSFREVPATLAAIGRLTAPPDLLLCDGQGYAHPRRFGLACHLGVLAGLPSIGVAKTRLIGEHANVPDTRGAWVPMTLRGETIGAVLRSRTGVKPIYISIGHRVSLPSAVELVMRCTPKFRLPETTRQAHRLASPKRVKP